MLDGSNLPVSGSLVIGAVLYAGLSVFGTGQVVGERLVEKSRWQQTCQRGLKAQIETNRPAPAFVPKMDCNSTLGLFGRDGRNVCRKYGNPHFKPPFMDQLLAHRRRIESLKAKRSANAAAKASTRCECASTLALEKQRIGLGLYAGSLRIIKPSALQNLKAELVSALHAPSCQMKG